MLFALSVIYMNLLSLQLLCVVIRLILELLVELDPITI